MNIFDIFRRKKTDYLLTNEDWRLLSALLYQYVNRKVEIPSLINKNDFIRLALLGNPLVYSVISMRARTAKGIPWLVYTVKNNRKFREYNTIIQKEGYKNLKTIIKLKEEAIEEVDAGPINELLANPHPDMTFGDLLEGMFIYRDTTGDAYLYLIKNPVTGEIIQLHLLPADKVIIVGGTTTEPIAGYKLESFGKEVKKDNVIHWRYFNPLWYGDGSELYGISPLVAASMVINSDNEGIKNQLASFANEGVKGILTGTEQTEIEFSPEQIDTLIKKLYKATQRAKEGKGNILFNRAPLNYVKIGETPVDLGVLDTRRFNKEILCNIFHIHPALLSTEASTLDNLKEARKALLTMSVLPDLDTLKAHLNKHIKKSFGEQYYIDYDLMGIPELQDDLEKLANTLNMMDWVTVNEKRAATMYDDYPHALADALFVEMNKIPLGEEIDSSFEHIDEEINKRR